MASYTVGRRPERIDRIAMAIYGTERLGTVERLYDANPGLALQGAFIAPGTVIATPPVAPASASTFVPPWMKAS